MTPKDSEGPLHSPPQQRPDCHGFQDGTHKGASMTGSDNGQGKSENAWLSGKLDGASQEVNNLRAESEARRLEHLETCKVVDQLRGELEWCKRELRTALDDLVDERREADLEIDRITRERDEARAERDVRAAAMRIMERAGKAADAQLRELRDAADAHCKLPVPNPQPDDVGVYNRLLDSRMKLREALAKVRS